jgi:hypothetical protein
MNLGERGRGSPRKRGCPLSAVHCPLNRPRLRDDPAGPATTPAAPAAVAGNAHHRPGSRAFPAAQPIAEHAGQDPDALALGADADRAAEGTRRRLLVHIDAETPATSARLRVRAPHTPIGRGMLHLLGFSRPGDRSPLARGRSELHTGSALGNSQAGQPDGKWHRNIPPVSAGKGEMVG